MRTFLIAALTAAAVATSTFVAPSLAAACGGRYGRVAPLQAFIVETHHETVDDGAVRSRAFVVLGAPGEVPPTARWRQLAPGTFNRSEIAPAPPLAARRTMTLLGPMVSHVVQLDDTVWLALGRSIRSPVRALDVRDAAGRPMIALEGAHPDARWIELGQAKPSKDELARAAHAGMRSLAVSVYIARGTDLRAVAGIDAKGQAQTYLGARRWDGTPIGVVVTGGGHGQYYAVLQISVPGKPSFVQLVPL
jgi:hypothetical protein